MTADKATANPRRPYLARYSVAFPSHAHLAPNGLGPSRWEGLPGHPRPFYPPTADGVAAGILREGEENGHGAQHFYSEREREPEHGGLSPRGQEEGRKGTGARRAYPKPKV